MRLLTVLLLAFLAGPLRAEIAGEEDPAFGAALEQWLAGEDAEALAGFAALARGGNAAAQVFLGQIEPAAYLHSQVTGGLQRKERIALLRQEGGLSGRSWLQAAAETTPLARALLDSREASARGGAVAPLRAAGEVRALLPVLSGEANRGEIGTVAEALLDPMLRPYSGYVAQIAVQTLRYGPASGERPSPEVALDLRDRVEFASDKVGEGDRMLYFFRPEELAGEVPGGIDDTARIVAAVPVLAPLRAVCERLCPESSARCTMALAHAGAPSGNSAMALLSPVESLLTSERYRRAPRFADDLLRQAKATSLPEGLLLRIDACIAAYVAGEE